MAYYFNNITAAISYSKIMATGSFFSYPLTINCWFYPTLTSYGVMNLVSLIQDVAADYHGLRINSNTNVVQYNTGTIGSAASSASYTTNTWNMATAVGTSATSRTVYLNAGNAGTQTTNRVITTPDRVLMGVSRTYDTPSYEGYLAEVAIWNVTLTTDELSSLYTGTKADQIRPQNLKFYMPLVRNIYDATASTTGITYEFDPNPEVNHVRRYG